MKNVASYSFKFALIVTLILLAAAIAVTAVLEKMPSGADHLPLFKFELKMFKTILAGFVIAMLGILIPAVASETREHFRQRKESRIAYSRAKTGADYLKLRLSVSNLSEATNALQAAHFHKHIAELFDDFPMWLDKRYDGKKSPEVWDKEMYKKLFMTRQILEKEGAHWDSLLPQARIKLLDEALPTISEI
jgi:hypothetical protein